MNFTQVKRLISDIYFRANVQVDKQEEIKNLLEVHNDLSKGRYFGLPYLIGRSKKLVLINCGKRFKAVV